jgi:hypothetical protein
MRLYLVYQTINIIFSVVGVSTLAKTSLVENFKHECKDDMDVNMLTLLLGEFSEGQVYWAISNPHTKNFTSKELQLETPFWGHFFILSTIPTVVSNSLFF